jgi:hypothetical protein
LRRRSNFVAQICAPILASALFAFWGLSHLDGQTGRSGLWGVANPLVNVSIMNGKNIDSEMGVVIAHARVLTTASDHDQVGASVWVQFRTLPQRGRNWTNSFSSPGRIIKVDHAHRLAMVSADTADAAPFVMPLKVSPKDAPYWYMRTPTPITNYLRGAATIWAMVSASAPDSFRSVPGGPVLVNNELVGIVFAKCGSGDAQENCITPLEDVRKFVLGH